VNESASSGFAFGLFIVFIVFTLLSIPSRFPFIGVVRPTVVLVTLITMVIVFTSGAQRGRDTSKTTRLLTFFIIYMLLSLPFVQWPGSVLRFGIEGFVKVVVFFFFTVQLVDTFKRLRLFVMTIVACQVFRVLEPLYLHLTTGYLGSQAHMSGGGFMGRLSGAPSDIINPNGLAFVVLTALPLLHYVFGGSPRFLAKLAYAALAPLLLYAFVLTGSRSGMVGLLVVLAMIVWKSRHRVILLSVVAIAAVILGGTMSVEMKDRYVSLVNVETQHGATRTGRIEGIKNEFRVGLNRPIFGHGLGTSREALFNFRGSNQIAHNLYTEVFIETGIIGLCFMLLILGSIVSNVREIRPAVEKLSLSVHQRGDPSGQVRLDFYTRCADAILVLVVMFLVFSLASYGLSEMYWYMIAGLAVALRNVVQDEAQRLA
jgi:putative inorganic carbon (hco3(-)) transporter